MTSLAAVSSPQTGPETEKRFPPLKLPPGFKATLFACDPLIEYPSAIALGPRPGTIFVAVDYMTGLGTEIVRRDEIRLVEDTDADGYADKAMVYADGFNSIQGMTFHAGTVYVMHAPLLTSLRDIDADGKADDRRDLVAGLGLTPEENPVRLHCANGLVMGHDGWLYLALGDHGCNVLRPEGDRLILNGGGILRCRPNGTDLHVFATGLRNIYDVALDDDLNVFVRDNENDGGDYKIRVCHSFFGADHGYPYLYYERPEEALPPLADLGLGSSAGGLSYLEQAFPADYHRNLFFCEWGRSVVRCRPERAGSSFGPVEEIEFAAAAQNDPYGFKPTDLVVERDGALMVADWADGQRPKRGRGRIYRIAYANRLPATDPSARQMEVEAFGKDKVEVRSAPLSPPPWPSPQGEGTVVAVVEESEASNRLQGRDLPLPLPKAEGRGEGEGGGNPSTINELSAALGRPVERRSPEASGFALRLAQLDSASYYERIEAQAALEASGRDGLMALRNALRKEELSVRARQHAVWILARTEGKNSVEQLFRLARNDPEPRVRAQVIRAVADLTDPVLAEHRLDAGPGDATLARRLAALGAREKDPRVLLEIVVALGRLQWANAPAWLRRTLPKSDTPLHHAAMQALRRSQNWAAILRLLEGSSGESIRAIALRALAERYQPAIVDGLIDRLRRERDPNRRREYADLLTRIYKKPAAWVYWGYRPPPRAANTVTWEKTPAIEQALDQALADPDRSVRLAVLRRMRREKIPTQTGTLDRWLREERDAEPTAAILDSLSDHPADRVRRTLQSVIMTQDHANTNRLAALTMFVARLDDRSETALLALAGSIEDGPVLAEALRHLAKHPKLEAAALLRAKLDTADAGVRAAAVEASAQFRLVEASQRIQQLVSDSDGRVRLAAVSAVGALQIKSATGELLKIAEEPDLTLRRASIDSLRVLKETRVVPLAVAALNHRETQRAALDCLGELGGPPYLNAVVDLAARDPSAEVLTAVIRLLTQWSSVNPTETLRLDHAAAELQGASGALLRWQTTGPLDTASASALIQQLTLQTENAEAPRNLARSWQTSMASGAESRVSPGTGKAVEEPTVWLARTDFVVSNSAPAQFLGLSRSPWRVWLNGQLAYQRRDPRSAGSDSDRFDALLRRGRNHLLVEVTSTNVAEFSLRFRRKSAAAEHEQLAQAALSRTGNVERGRKLFFNVEKSQCLKCHRLADQGEAIGPDLTGVGGRFSRVHIIESILEPSRTIAPSFQSTELLLRDGTELSGVQISERDGTLLIADSQGRKHALAKSSIQQQRTATLSLMPEGLEKALTREEFIDLVEFLVNQKQDRGR